MNDRNLKPQTPLAIAVATLGFFLQLAATIYSFTDWSRSGTFNPADNFALVKGDQYKFDFFTPDAWNCQLEDYIPSYVESNRLETLCTEGTAARTMTLALAVLGAVVLYVTLLRTYRRHKQTQPSPAVLERNLTSRSGVSLDERTIVGDEKYAPGDEK